MVESECSLFDGIHNFIGIIHSELQLLDVLCQVKRKKLSGFYILQHGKKFEIGSDGSMPSNFSGYNLYSSMMEELYDIK